MYTSATTALYLKRNHFVKVIVRVLSKLFASLMRNYYPKRPSSASLYTSSYLYDVPISFVAPLILGSELRYLWSQRVAVARFRMICLVI